MITALITYVIDPAKVDALKAATAARDWYRANTDAPLHRRAA